MASRPSAENVGTPSADALLAQLRRTHASLSPKLALAAAYLIERPDEIAFTSMRQIADRAGVQPAIMVRLAQKLGFRGYEELRTPFRADLQRRPAGIGQRARDLQARIGQRGGGKPLERLAHEMIALERENLAATLDAIGSERLAEISRLLADASVLYVSGQRSLFPAACYVHQVASMFRQNVVLLDGTGTAFSDPLRRVGPEDTLLVFSFEPHPRETVMAISFAHTHGARIVAVTDGFGSPLDMLADEVLPVAVDGPGLLPSVLSAMAIAQILIHQMLAQGGQAALEAIAATEAQLDAFFT